MTTLTLTMPTPPSTPSPPPGAALRSGACVAAAAPRHGRLALPAEGQGRVSLDLSSRASVPPSFVIHRLWGGHRSLGEQLHSAAPRYGRLAIAAMGQGRVSDDLSAASPVTLSPVE
jgi:hypothetical protein